MSCCNGNSQNQNMENFAHNPLDYDQESQTYTIDNNSYYSPPWPAQRSVFDMDLQQKLNTSSIPDFLNYSSHVASSNAPHKPNRKSLITGQYYNGGNAYNY